MTSPQAATPLSRPSVVADERSAPFFDGAANGQLVIQRCDGCQTWLAPVKKMCTECLSEDLSWAPVSGRATVHSFALMHQLYHPAFKGEIPYNVTVVELEEGPRMPTNIVNCANDDIKVGMKVSVVFEKAGEAMVPKFAPA